MASPLNLCGWEAWLLRRSKPLLGGGGGIEVEVARPINKKLLTLEYYSATATPMTSSLQTSVAYYLLRAHAAVAAKAD